MMPQDEMIARLARQIEAAKKSEQCAEDTACVAALRKRGAGELHSICAAFASSVNSRMSQAALDVTPAAYTDEMFRESGPNLIRLGAQGREMQITFQATGKLFSTEKFVTPYVLEGEVRTYNQEMLEHFQIRSLAVFFCVENARTSWRFFDWRTRRTGLLDSELLASLMGRLF